MSNFCASSQFEMGDILIGNYSAGTFTLCY